MSFLLLFIYISIYIYRNISMDAGEGGISFIWLHASPLSIFVLGSVVWRISTVYHFSFFQRNQINAWFDLNTPMYIHICALTLRALLDFPNHCAFTISSTTSDKRHSRKYPCFSMVQLITPYDFQKIQTKNIDIYIYNANEMRGKVAFKDTSDGIQCAFEGHFHFSKLFCSFLVLDYIYTRVKMSII